MTKKTQKRILVLFRSSISDKWAVLGRYDIDGETKTRYMVSKTETETSFFGKETTSRTDYSFEKNGDLTKCEVIKE